MALMSSFLQGGEVFMALMSSFLQDGEIFMALMKLKPVCHSLYNMYIINIYKKSSLCTLTPTSMVLHRVIKHCPSTYANTERIIIIIKKKILKNIKK